MICHRAMGYGGEATIMRNQEGMDRFCNANRKRLVFNRWGDNDQEWNTECRGCKRKQGEKPDNIKYLEGEEL